MAMICAIRLGKYVHEYPIRRVWLIPVHQSNTDKPTPPCPVIALNSSGEAWRRQP